MTGHLPTSSNATPHSVEAPPDRNSLVLQALVRITRQYASQPDFFSLVHLIMLTVSGQLSVGNIFTLFWGNDSRESNPVYAGTGKWRDNHEVAARFRAVPWREMASRDGGHCRAYRLEEIVEDQSLAALHDDGVSLIVPIRQGKATIGLFALGRKVTGRSFTDDDIELLVLLLDTLTPLMANSRLFTELNRLNTWYLDILDSVRHGVFIFDAADHLQAVNFSGREIHRWLAGPATGFANPVGHHIDEVFPAEYCTSWKTQLSDLKNGVTTGRQLLVAMRDDEERIFALHVSQTGSSQTGARDLIVTLDDVTPQRKSEARLYELEKLADKGAMLSSISHDLNNFLGLIIGGVELSQISLAKGKLDKLTGQLEKLQANATKMQRFTAGLVDAHRLDTTKHAANLNDLIKDALSFLQVQKRFKRVLFDLRLDSSVPAIPLDSDAISQLLLNMLNNAADAINETKRADGRITVQTAADGEAVLLSVNDNGAGIRPEVRDKLFHTHLTTKTDGHGYGLVTCAKIVEDHGATVTIESEPGHGASFQFRFPIPL